MQEYFHWDEKKISDFSDASSLYDKGYVFTRLGRGVMHQTRSIRIDLSSFELSSENKRVLRKTQEMEDPATAQLPVMSYNWMIGKLAKDFYDTKFGAGTFSANKVKELLTEQKKSNFNLLLEYVGDTLGYAICYENNDLLHYSYPFYELDSPAGTGMGMMIRAIQLAKKNNKKYIYLGSAQRPTDVYKLQFKGLEWFDKNEWKDDIKELKTLLRV